MTYCAHALMSAPVHIALACSLLAGLWVAGFVMGRNSKDIRR
jgi:hypothetical protein